MVKNRGDTFFVTPCTNFLLFFKASLNTGSHYIGWLVEGWGWPWCKFLIPNSICRPRLPPIPNGISRLSLILFSARWLICVERGSSTRRKKYPVLREGFRKKKFDIFQTRLDPSPLWWRIIKYHFFYFFGSKKSFWVVKK